MCSRDFRGSVQLSSRQSRRAARLLHILSFWQNRFQELTGRCFRTKGQRSSALFMIQRAKRGSGQKIVELQLHLSGRYCCRWATGACCYVHTTLAVGVLPQHQGVMLIDDMKAYGLGCNGAASNVSNVYNADELHCGVGDDWHLRDSQTAMADPLQVMIIAPAKRHFVLHAPIHVRRMSMMSLRDNEEVRPRRTTNSGLQLFLLARQAPTGVVPLEHTCAVPPTSGYVHRGRPARRLAFFTQNNKRRSFSRSLVTSDERPRTQWYDPGQSTTLVSFGNQQGNMRITMILRGTVKVQYSALD